MDDRGGRLPLPFQRLRRRSPTPGASVRIEQRRYGRGEEVLAIPDLTELQIKSYEDFLQADLPGTERGGLRARGDPPRDLPDRVLRQDDVRSSTSGYELGQPALHDRRVPRAAAHLRHAVQGPRAPREGRARRGGGLPRRDPDHDRRRRVHRQRRRARDRQPAPPLARRRLLASRSHAGEKKLHSCWIIPERGSWIELNVTKKDVLAVRSTSRQVPGDDVPARDRREVRVRRGDHPRSSTRPRRSSCNVEAAPSRSIDGQARRSATSSIPTTGEVLVTLAASSSSDEAASRSSRGPTSRRSRSSTAPRRTSLILNTLREDSDEDATRRRCSRSTQRLRPGNPPQIEKAKDALRREVLRPVALPPRPRRPLPPQPQVRPEGRARTR